MSALPDGVYAVSGEHVVVIEGKFVRDGAFVARFISREDAQRFYEAAKPEPTVHAIAEALQEALPEGAKVFVDVLDGQIVFASGCYLNPDKTLSPIEPEIEDWS